MSYHDILCICSRIISPSTYNALDIAGKPMVYQCPFFFPEPKSPTVLTDQSENSITLTIERPAGVVDNYVVRCSVADPGAVRPCVPAAKTERVNSAQVCFCIPSTFFIF